MAEEIQVEIVLAAYQGEHFIREQVDSILKQSDSRWHLTVSDDGSTDQTLQILDEYAARYPGKISRYRAPQRFGCARDHFFHLMRQVNAPLMMFSDQDDTWYPDKVKRMLEAAEDAQGDANTPLLVFSDQTPTDASLHPLAPSLMRYQQQAIEGFDYRSILMQNVVTGGAMMINRALAELGGQCVRPLDVIMHDWWLAAVAARFGHIIYIDEPLGTYRQHGKNSVGAKDVGSVRHVMEKLSHLKTLRETILQKKQQAQVFLDTYEASLSQGEAAFLKGFAKARSGPAFYWRNRQWIHGFWRLAGAMCLG